jgi:hypothetical protein
MQGCTKCGTLNELGHVFCKRCGTRLDLSHMSSQEMGDQESGGGWVRTHLGKIVRRFIFLAIAATAGVALWPQQAPIGEAGSRASASSVSRSVLALRQIVAGRELGRDFAEADINAYFSQHKNRELGADSVSVAIGEGDLRVRVVRSFRSVKLGRFEVRPAFSGELRFVPAGNLMRVQSGVAGHLPLMGPAAYPVIAWFRRIAGSQQEGEILNLLREAKVVQGRLTLVCGR